MLGLRFCARASSSCSKRGPLFIAVRGPLTIVASLVAEHRLQTRRLSSCGSRAQLLRGMWDLPKSGLKPVSPTLAGRFSTTAPPGKPLVLNFWSPGAKDFGQGSFSFLKKINLFILFIYFWLHWVFVAAHRLSLVAASGGYSLLPVRDFSLQWLLLLRSTGSRHGSFSSSCGMQAQ